MGNVAATLLKAHSSHTSDASFHQHLQYEVIYLVLKTLGLEAAFHKLLNLCCLRSFFFKMDFFFNPLPQAPDSTPDGRPLTSGGAQEPSTQRWRQELQFFVVCFVFLAALLGSWDLSFPNGDRTRTPAVKVQSPNHWITREFPRMMFLTT